MVNTDKLLKPRLPEGKGEWEDEKEKRKETVKHNGFRYSTGIFNHYIGARYNF